MRILIIILAVGLFSCGQALKDKKSVVEKVKMVEKVEKVETTISDLPTIGEKIQGDFNGDRHMDTATATKIKEGKGNPVEDGTADEYAIQFSETSLKSIDAGCCSICLINEGDLNNDGTDEISIFQAPMNGCTCSMTSHHSLR
ncbi:hypothetical protein [Pinibacter soli]|uniref:VCBS repeat-containing protein n=1 Tax=Pinibacter soli TaxID=3044211 RepID=A0ABT6RHW7_9BACT|nr:hypothetical protein [Pinibacter soli]MDI3321422.1 hypothetical protein [Pinibacter soli]